MSSFDAASSPGRAPGADGDGGVHRGLTGPRNRQWIVLLLDGERIPRQYADVVLETARALVDEVDAETDRVGVAALTGTGLRFLVEFSTPSAAKSALRAIPRNGRPRPGVDDLVDALMPCRSERDPAACVVHASEDFRHHRGREAREATDALAGLVAAMSPLPGRKALFFLSGGLLFHPGEVTLDAAAAVGGDAESLRTILEDPYPAEFEALLEQATRSRVSIFALRAGYSEDLPFADIAQRSVARDTRAAIVSPHRTAARSVEHGLRTLAEATGGRAVFTPLGRSAAKGLLDQLDGVYTLGVEALPGDRPGARVDVSVSRKGARVRVLDRLLRRRAVPITIPGSAETDFSEHGATGSSLDLVLRLSNSALGVRMNDDTGSEERRVAIYTRILSSGGTVHHDDYRIVEFPVLASDSAWTTHRISLGVGPGRYVARVNVSDLVAHGMARLTTRFTLAPPAHTDSGNDQERRRNGQ